MDMRELAGYAYHNCEFARAIALVRSAPHVEETAAVLVKALNELDEKETAAQTAEEQTARFPESGLLLYLLGLARYLAGQPRPAIETPFLAAAERGFAGGPMGLAFLEATAGRIDSALALLGGAAPAQAELQHARRLSLFQTLTLAGRLDEAEAELREADRILVRAPSLLRQLWGQLCWVRLLRAKGRFDGALALVERMLAQLDAETTPRLHRNASEARRMVEAKSDKANLILPREEGHVPSALDRITRKPMLHSLFVYLSARGQAGATKEELVERVWEESYNPMVHDDRIYKAVGRLRKLLGDDQQAPRYLTQMGRHYVLNFPAGETAEAGDRACATKTL